MRRIPTANLTPAHLEVFVRMTQGQMAKNPDRSAGEVFAAVWFHVTGKKTIPSYVADYVTPRL